MQSNEKIVDATTSTGPNFKYDNYINIFECEFSDDKTFNVLMKNSGYVNVTRLCCEFHAKLQSFGNTKICRQTIADITEQFKKKSVFTDLSKDFGGKYYHPRLAIILCYWISADIGLKMETFIKEKIKILKIKQVEKQVKIAKQKIEVKKIIEEITSHSKEPKGSIQVDENNKIKLFTYKHSILKLNDIEIIAREEDGYVNLTELCRAGGKHFKHWNELNKSKEFLDVLFKDLENSEVVKTTSELIKVGTGSKHDNSHTWGHPQIAINVAQWISAEFNVKVSKWIFELMLTGKVELGNEKSNEELESIYKEKLEFMQKIVSDISKENLSIKKSFSHLTKLHDTIKYKRNYHKFKRGNCLYLFIDRWRDKQYIKFGFTDDINERLSQHRTACPDLQVLLIVYLKEHKFLEESIRIRYDDKLTHKNHEYIIDIDTDQFIKEIKSIIKFFKINATYEESLDKYNNPYDIKNLNYYSDDKEENDEDIICKCKGDDCYCELSKVKQTRAVIKHLSVKNSESKEDLNDELEDNIFIDKDKKTKISDKYTCEDCGKLFTKEHFYLKHQIDQHGKKELEEKLTNTVCDICNTTLSSPYHLRRHINTVHLKTNVVTCALCNQEYSSNESLENHIKVVHNKEQESPCKLCNLVFTTKGNLKAHVDSFHEKKNEVKCDECDKKMLKRNLATHKETFHSGKSRVERKSHICEICDSKYTSKYNLATHMAKVHKV